MQEYKRICPKCNKDSLITLSSITYCMNECCNYTYTYTYSESE